jgi:hypothetical protein
VLEAHDDGACELSMSHGPCPAPALADGLDPKATDEILEVIVSHVVDVARRAGARRVTFRRTPLARRATVVESEPLLRHGFIDVSLASHVIDLAGRTEQDLWREVRHGHRYDIRRGQRDLSVSVCHGDAFDAATFERYVDLHRRAAGRVTRPRKTFDLMARWIRDGAAALFMASRANETVGSALVLLHGDGAFYASAANDPGSRDVPAGHVLQWSIIRWLRERGVRRYDLGLRSFDLPHALASEKERAISLFKRGFGGRTVPLVVVERYLDADFYRREMAARAERYASVLG